MAHELGTWSIARRPRETLASINVNSGIPLPDSTMKRSTSTGGHLRSESGPRQSVAKSRPSQPLPQRSSLGVNLAEPGLFSVKRSSFYSQRGLHTGVPQTPGTTRLSVDSDRRSSAFRPRQSSNAACGYHSFFQTTLQPASVPRDPRPLKDRSYQARIGQELLQYMARHGFEAEMSHVLSPNVVKSPTQKDFNCMFQWFYHRIDPSHRFLKNIDQEVPPILKQLKYPYERSITKSQLAAVGGQNWSTFLGLLHWMMLMAQMRDGYTSNKYAEACLDAGVDVSGDLIIFDFLSSAYTGWLSTDDNTSDEDFLKPHIEAMAAAFEHSRSKYDAELDTLAAEHARLLKEAQELEKSIPDPRVLDDNSKTMEEDTVKFEEYNTLTTQRCGKYEHRIQILQEELESLKLELQEAAEERRKLQKAVDAQDISMQDIDRMTSERERLQKSIETASQNLGEGKRRVTEQEAETCSRFEELECMVKQFNALAYRNALTPATAPNAQGHDYELRILGSHEPNFTFSEIKDSSIGYAASTKLLPTDSGTGELPEQVLSLDVRGNVLAVLLTLQKEVSDRRAAAVDEMANDNEQLGGIKEVIQDKQGGVEALEHRVRTAEDDYEAEREVTTRKKMESDKEVEKMEKDVSRMRTCMPESAQLLDQREKNAEAEFEQLLCQANARREELHTEVDRIVDDVMRFKIQIQKDLGEYEGLVREEMENELGVEDEGRDYLCPMDSCK